MKLENFIPQDHPLRYDVRKKTTPIPLFLVTKKFLNESRINVSQEYAGENPHEIISFLRIRRGFSEAIIVELVKGNPYESEDGKEYRLSLSLPQAEIGNIRLPKVKKEDVVISTIIIPDQKPKPELKIEEIIMKPVAAEPEIKLAKVDRKPEINKNWPKKIKAIRAKANVSQTKLSEMMGVNYNVVSLFETGRKMMTAEQHDLFFKALGLEADPSIPIASEDEMERRRKHGGGMLKAKPVKAKPASKKEAETMVEQFEHQKKLFPKMAKVVAKEEIIDLTHEVPSEVWVESSVIKHMCAKQVTDMIMSPKISDGQAKQIMFLFNNLVAMVLTGE